MARISWLLGLLLLFAPLVSQSAQQTYVGPVTVRANLKKTVGYDSTFTATPQNTGILLIKNGSGQDLSLETCSGNLIKKLICQVENLAREIVATLERPSFIEITLNGKVVVATSQLKQTSGSLQIPVALIAKNRLQIRLGTLPTQYLSVTVKGNTAQPNQTPIANFTATPASGAAPETVSFNALMSSDPDGQIQDYFWDFGDGQTGTGSIITHLYANAGTYTARLTVTDNQGAQSQKTATITLQANQSPIANFSITPVSSQLTIHVDGSGSSDPDGQIASWFYDFGDGSGANTAIADHTYAASGTYSVTLTVTDNKGSTHSSTKSVTLTAKLPPIAKLKANSPTTGVAPLVVLLDASESSSPHGAPLSYVFDYGDGQTESSSSGQTSHIYQQAGSYTVKLLVKDDEDRTSEKELTVVASNPTLPPNPGDTAPPIPEVQGQILADSVSFLYTGPNASQTNVQPGVIDANRVAVLRGKVSDEEGNPLSGVQISVLEMPEVGSTLTHADGHFDLVVNGGGSLTVKYQRNGYFPLQRKVATTFQDYFWADDVVMIAPNPTVSRVAMNSSSMQVTQPVTVSDSSGERTATLMIPSNTTATMEMPDGTIRNLPSLSVRMTEYTVGDQGPKRMPAALPATTSYTYAVDLSADEALALGASRVNFSKPLPYYVDNFLGFPIGTAVPLGSYNYKIGAWEAEEDGIVLKVLDIQNNQAILSLNATGAPATQAALDDLEITTEELTQIAQRFSAGKSFWRAQITHFSPWDLNWIMTTGVSLAFNGIMSKHPVQNCICSPKSEGSIIDINSQSLGEILDLPGTPHTLRYNSLTMPGRSADRTITVPIADSANQLNPYSNVHLHIEVAGQTYDQDLPTNTLTTSWTWDGKDAFGREIHTSVPARVRLDYESPLVYRIFQRQSGLRSFTLPVANAVLSSVPGRDVARITRTTTIPISMDSLKGSTDVGGWTFDSVHHYNPSSRQIYLGTGEILDTADMVPLVVTVAGSALAGGNTGDGGYATQARFSGISSIALASDGSIFIADFGNSRIRKISPDGKIQHLISISGEINSMATDADGALYFVNRSTHKIQKLNSNGSLETIAGTGSPGFSGDGGPAINAQLNAPLSMVRDNDGTIYFSDRGNGRIRKISPSGIISTFAGTGLSGGSTAVDGALGVNVNIGVPTSLALGPNHTLYFTTGIDAQSNNESYVRSILNDGTIRTLAGTTATGYTGDNGPAVLASLSRPRGIDVSADGTIFFIDYGNFVIRSITTDGIIKTVAGGWYRNSNSAPLPSTAPETTFNSPYDLKIYDGNSLLIGDQTFLRMYRKSLPAYSSNGYSIPSKDGSEIYQFTANGTHVRTLFSKTGATKFSFNHSTTGHLIAIQDKDQKTTSIERDSSGNPLSITGPFGSVSQIATTSDGYLKSLTNPNDEKYQMSYFAGGLLSSFTKPSGASSTFEFNAMGELTKDTDALGGYKALARTDSGKSYSVVQTTAQGRKTTVNVTTSLDTRMETLYPDNSRINETITTTGRSITGPWSTMNGSTISVDPRLGGPAQFARAGTLSDGNHQHQFTVAMNYTPLSTTDIFKFAQTYLVTESTRVTNYTYDSTIRTQNIQTSLGRTSSVKTDPQERPTQIVVGTQSPINYTYNSNGQLIAVQQGDRLSQFTYDSQGNLRTSTNALNQSTTYSYDQNGRILASVDSLGAGPSVTYDGNGNLKTLVSPEGPVHEFVSNLIDLFSIYNPPSAENSGATSFTYSLDRDMTKETRATGSEINYTYNPTTGQLTRAQGQLKTYDFGYTTQSRYPNRYSSSDGIVLSAAIVNQGYRQRLYSGAVAGQLLYTYNSSGLFNQLPSFTLGSVKVDLGYDSDSLLTSAGGMSIVRDASNGFVQSETLNSVVTNHEYNTYGEKSRMTTTAGSSTLYDVQYTRDLLGRVSTKTETVLGVTTTTTYAYDARGRLISSSGHQYTYSGNGNRLSVDGTTYQHDAQDRLLQAGDKRYTYTAHGTLLTKEDVGGANKVTYTYDDFGQLSKVQLANGTIIDYLTGGENHRIVKKVNGVVTQKFLYHNALQVAAELLPSNSVKSIFVYGTQPHSPDLMLQGSTTYRFIKDQLGSVRLVVNTTTGEIAQRIDYDDFGKVLQDTNPGFQPFGFAGGLYDADTGLIRFGARDYDPEIGRWTTKDPIRFNGDSANLYVYVNNNPVNLIDPTGLWSISLSGYAGWGGGIIVGKNPDRTTFVTLQGGVGVGGGISWDPNGKSDDKACSGVSIGQYASLGANLGPLEGNVGLSSGFANKGGSYYNDPAAAAGLTPSLGAKAGISGGIQATWHW